MNGAQAHLILVHFPVAGSVGGVLLLLWAFRSKNLDVLRVALAAVVLAALSAALALWTGEGAADVVGALPESTGGWIHRHEEAAEAAALVLGLAGVLALGGLIFFRRQGGPRPAYVGAVLLAAAAGAVLMGRAAHHGGLVRHTEIRAPGDAPAAPAEPHEH